ncbi:type VI secretion system baseplate subunit TssG [Cellvibrio sp.]
MNSPAPLPDKLAELLNELEANPFAMDLFSVMRRIDASTPDQLQLGQANRYIQEPLQFGQEPSSKFASSSIAKLYRFTNDRKPKLAINSFGLFGPNGAMPLVFTEYVKERMAHHGDYSLSDFADIFHNRLIMLFYRAWADSQSCASLDRQEEKFTHYIAQLSATGIQPNSRIDSIPDHARWHNTGHLLRQARNAEGLKNILSNFFKIPVRIEEFVSHWLKLPGDEQTRLGKIKGTQLGFDAVLGQKVLDRQHHFRIHLGPMTQYEYDQFLPCTHQYQQLRDWVRNYIGVELTWDLHLILKNSGKATGMTLGGKQRLGWNSWIQSSADRRANFSDAIFSPEKNHAH